MAINLTDKRILLTGGAGFLGRYVFEELKKHGADESNIFVPRSSRWDLRDWQNCEEVVGGMDIVIHLAAKVGGIGLNMKKPGELFYDNLIMGIQLMEAARKAGVQKFVAVGTVCAYPKLTNIPFREEDFWNGYPEETNAAYGLAKKMLLVQAQAYRKQHGFNAIYLIPTNLYGPGDNFDPESSHVIPALIQKVYLAKLKHERFVSVWGTGAATRDFLYVEDAARAIVLATKEYDKPEPINIGSGREIAIRDLVVIIMRWMDFQGEVLWDASKPNGQPWRFLNATRALEEFGFMANTKIYDGLQKTVSWFLEKEAEK